jgi:hypothetical protein
LRALVTFGKSFYELSPKAPALALAYSKSSSGSRFVGDRELLPDLDLLSLSMGYRRIGMSHGTVLRLDLRMSRLNMPPLPVRE